MELHYNNDGTRFNMLHTVLLQDLVKCQTRETGY